MKVITRGRSKPVESASLELLLSVRDGAVYLHHLMGHKEGWKRKLPSENDFIFFKATDVNDKGNETN